MCCKEVTSGHIVVISGLCNLFFSHQEVAATVLKPNLAPKMVAQRSPIIALEAMRSKAGGFFCPTRSQCGRKVVASRSVTGTLH